MSVKKRNGRWRARYRGPDGLERSKTFDKKGDADDWISDARAQLARGTWVDPARAKTPFRDWAKEWQAAQVHHRPNTAASVKRALDHHLLPTFGRYPVGAIRRTHVQAWVKKQIELGAAPTSIATRFAWLATIMRAAVDDRLIGETPCRKINLPEAADEPVTIPTVEQLEAIEAGMPAAYRRLVAVIAGTGLREGEALGLLLRNVDFLRRTVTVDHQQQQVDGEPAMVPVKRPASNRTVPVGEHTLAVLAAQVKEYPPGDDGRLWRSGSGAALTRGVFGPAWRRAAKAAKCPDVTPHDGRHFYASLLIRHGLSVPVVAARLGHGDGTEVLRTYAHLWPDDDDRTRQAVDLVLGDAASARPGPDEAAADQPSDAGQTG